MCGHGLLGQPLPRFPPACPAKVTGKCTTGGQPTECGTLACYAGCSHDRRRVQYNSLHRSWIIQSSAYSPLNTQLLVTTNRHCTIPTWMPVWLSSSALHLLKDSAVRDETCLGVYWNSGRTFWALLSISQKLCQHRCFFLVLALGTRAQSLHTLYFPEHHQSIFCKLRTKLCKITYINFKLVVKATRLDVLRLHIQFRTAPCFLKLGTRYEERELFSRACCFAPRERISVTFRIKVTRTLEIVT
jgi:hypothetical protein